MWWILVEVRSPDTKLFLVRIDPFPQNVARGAPLCTCLALHAHEIGSKPVTITTAATSAVVRTVGRSLVASRDLLSVIIAERAGYARRKAGVLHRMKRIIQLPFEVPIHASDHVVLQ